MKKNQTIQYTIESLRFPGVGVGEYNGKTVKTKGGIPGQTVESRIKRNQESGIEAKLLRVVEPSVYETEAGCPHFADCGGCSTIGVAYERQLTWKQQQLIQLFAEHGLESLLDGGLIVHPSPVDQEYKNKMEYTFGNETKGAPLALGLHMKTRYKSILETDRCRIVDGDYRQILKCTDTYFKEQKLPFYRIFNHEGYLRHLVLRKGKNTGEILVNLVTSSQLEFDLSEYVERLLSLELEGRITGILHTVNDSLSDAVQADELRVLYGSDIFHDQLLGSTFRISPFSFFQTNTKGAEVLYRTVIDFIGKDKGMNIFDLYSGTGTIGILLAKAGHTVFSIEIVEEAVEMAKQNAKLNQVETVQFLCGDVKEEVQKLNQTPDLIVLDPPRAGIHPKAMRDIIDFGAEHIVYVSCNPKALMIDLEALIRAGYRVERVEAVDMFPNTPHVECVVLMTHQKH